MEEIRGHKEALTSFILGIVSCVSMFFGSFAFIGIVCGIVGIVFANKSKKQGNDEGIRKAGFVLSIIGTVLSALVFVIIGLALGALFGAAALMA